MPFDVVFFALTETVTLSPGANFVPVTETFSAGSKSRAVTRCAPSST